MINCNCDAHIWNALAHRRKRSYSTFNMSTFKMLLSAFLEYLNDSGRSYASPLNFPWTFKLIYRQHYVPSIILFNTSIQTHFSLLNSKHNAWRKCSWMKCRVMTITTLMGLVFSQTVLSVQPNGGGQQHSGILLCNKCGRITWGNQGNEDMHNYNMILQRTNSSCDWMVAVHCNCIKQREKEKTFIAVTILIISSTESNTLPSNIRKVPPFPPFPQRQSVWECQHRQRQRQRIGQTVLFKDVLNIMDHRWNQWVHQIAFQPLCIY